MYSTSIVHPLGSQGLAMHFMKKLLTLLFSRGPFCTHRALSTSQLQCDPGSPRSVMILEQWKTEIFVIFLASMADSVVPGSLAS